MTNLEKIHLLKDTIVQLYCKEGRSKSYISRLLEVDRNTLTCVMNNEWHLEQANVHYLSPSKRKFLNRYKRFIKDRIDSDMPLAKIAELLDVSRHFLSVKFINHDPGCKEAYRQYNIRKKNKTRKRIEKKKQESGYIYDPEDLENEEWRPILGYPGYLVSNMGRFKHYSERYKSYHLLLGYKNKYCGYYYIGLGKKNLAIHRIVAHTFVSGYDEEHNTVNHKDGNKENNKASNLEWISQAENNLHKYRELKCAPSYKTHDFNEIILNDKYHFKTIRALAKFLNLSETQTARYLYNKTANNPYDFKLV